MKLLAVAAALALVLVGSWWTLAGQSDAPGEPDAGPARAGAAPAAGADALARHAAPPGKDRGFYAAPAGSEFVYRFTAAVQSRIEVALTGQPTAQDMLVRLDGALTVLVVDRRAEELVAQVTLADAKVEQTVAGVAERGRGLEELLALPAFVRMRDDGELLGFAFDARANAYANNLVRTILCGFRFVAAAPAAPARECEETDPTGIATVRYEALGADRDGDERMRRTKLRYRSAPSSAGSLQLAYEVDSVALGRLSPDLGWLRAAQVNEALTARAAAAGVCSTTRYDASIDLAARTMRDLAALPAAPWDGDWAPVDGAADTQAIGASSARELEEAELGGATLASLVQDIVALAGAEPVDSAALTGAAHKLALLVRLRAQTLVELSALLPTTAPFAADVLLGAVGAAGTDPAQQFLAGVTGDAGAAMHLRQSALDAMVQLGAPNDAVLDSVRSLIGDGDAHTELRDNALLVFGALGSRQPRSQGVDRDRLVAELVGQQERARADGRLEHWLHALGNTRHPQVLTALEPYLAAPDRGLRHASLSALRQLDGQAATDMLLARARSERDPRVRTDAIEALAQRADSAAIAHAGDVLRSDPDPDARRAAVAGLGRQAATSADARALLERAARHDPSRVVRDAAERALAPK